eukprot:2889454-Alexandrium_andersonii.AAC.1
MQARRSRDCLSRYRSLEVHLAAASDGSGALEGTSCLCITLMDHATLPGGDAGTRKAIRCPGPDRPTP